MKKESLFLIFLVLLFSCKIDNAPADTYKNTNPNYVILSKSDNLQNIIKKTNAVYQINYDFDLKGKTLTIPENCTLKFGSNGSLKNGTIKFNNTTLSDSVSFYDINVSGSVNNYQIQLSWFHFTKDESKEAQDKTNASLLEQIIKISSGQIIVNDFYPIGKTVTVEASAILMGKDWTPQAYCSDYNYTYTPKTGFYTVLNTGLFSLKNNSIFTLYGIKLTGNTREFSKNTLPAFKTSAISAYYNPSDSYERGSIGAVYNCIFEGFTYGINARGTYIEKIQNTTFDTCHYGIYVFWTSDFDVFSCRFLNCGKNLDMTVPNPVTDTNIEQIKMYASAIYSSDTGMLNLNNNYFENNFISITLAYADIIQNIQNSYFKDSVLCDIFSLNSKNNWEIQIDNNGVYNPSIDCVSISGNTFERTKNNILNTTMFIREAENKGTNIVYSDNKIIDKRTSVPEYDCIFLVSNDSINAGNITVYNNNFTSSKAKYFATLLSVKEEHSHNENQSIFNFTTSNNKYNSSLNETKLGNNTSNNIQIKTQ